ncbi:MAG: hypothetical protein ABL886_08755 [Rhodoglobus sp.]
MQSDGDGLSIEDYPNSFWCVRDDVLLGNYRSGLWTVHRQALAGSIEQIVVSLHERLHHELQHTTAWGLMTEMVARLAESQPHRRDQFKRLARFGRDASRTAHEVFATGHSIGSHERRLRWLSANEPYQRYYDLAVVLAGGQFDEKRFGFDALVRCAMAAPELEPLLARGLERLRVRDLDHPVLRPDSRLERIVASIGLIDLPSDPDGASIQHLADFHDSVADVVRAIGVPVLSSAGIRGAFASIIDSVAHIDPTLHARLELDSTREPIEDDLEEAQREQVVLRYGQGLPLRIVGPEVGGRRLINFDESLGPHVVLLWVKATVLTDQFDLDSDLAADWHYVLAMVALVKEGSEVEAVEGLVVDGAGGPDEVAAHLGSLRTLAITTATSLFDAPGTAMSTHVPVLYALVDAPVLHQLEHTIGAAIRIEWDSFDLKPGEELCVTVFEIAALPGIRWIHLATIAGRSYFLSWLESQSSEQVRRSRDRFVNCRQDIDAVVAFIKATWRHLSMSHN